MVEIEILYFIFIVIISIVLIYFINKIINILNNQKSIEYNKFINFSEDNLKASIMNLNLILDLYFDLFLKHKEHILFDKNDSTSNLNNRLEIERIYSDSITDILSNYISQNLLLQLNYYFTKTSLSSYMCSYFGKLFQELN
jgi:hypothetical protein